VKRTVLVVGYAAKDASALGLALLCGGFTCVLVPDLEAGLVHLRGGRVDAVLSARALADSTDEKVEEFRKAAAVWRIPVHGAAPGTQAPALMKLLAAPARS
jgi:hypothetical protein